MSESCSGWSFRQSFSWNLHSSLITASISSGYMTCSFRVDSSVGLPVVSRRSDPIFVVIMIGSEVPVIVSSDSEKRCVKEELKRSHECELTIAIDCTFSANGPASALIGGRNYRQAPGSRPREIAGGGFLAAALAPSATFLGARPRSGH